jgi:hypothetical protein
MLSVPLHGTLFDVLTGVRLKAGDILVDPLVWPNGSRAQQYGSIQIGYQSQIDYFRLYDEKAVLLYLTLLPPICCSLASLRAIGMALPSPQQLTLMDSISVWLYCPLILMWYR